jgi:hypothetical protein
MTNRSHPDGGIRCPACGHNESMVKDSRAMSYGIRRRRKCMLCGLRCTTVEVLKQDSTRVMAAFKVAHLLTMLPPYRRLAIERLLLSLAHEATGGTDADAAAIVAATQALHGLHE